MTHRFSHALTALLFAALALTAAGCDSNDDEDDSDFAVLEATWETTRFFIDNADLTGRLIGDSGEYVAVTFIFSEDPDTNIRRFEIRAQGRNEGETRQVSGRVDISASNNDLFFDPETGDISPSFILDYEIADNTRINLQAEDGNGSGAALRALLLPTVGIGGSTPDVRLTIERSAFPEN